jgi:hypothetical protein
MLSNPEMEYIIMKMNYPATIYHTYIYITIQLVPDFYRFRYRKALKALNNKSGRLSSGIVTFALIMIVNERPQINNRILQIIERTEDRPGIHAG